MKKKLMALAAAFFMIFTMVGCSKEGVALVDKMQEVSAWKNVEQSGSMSINTTVGEETLGMDLDYTARMADVVKLEMTMTPKKVTYSGATIDTTQGKFKVSPVKCYMDGAKFYFGTAIFKELSAITGEDLSKEIDLTKEYIAIDMNNIMKQLGVDFTAEGIQKQNKEIYEQFKKLNTEIPVVQKDNTYTIELNANQMATATCQLLIETMKQSQAQLEAQYKTMGLTDAQIKEAIAASEQMFGKETQAEIEKAINGSKAKLAYTFGKDEYTVDLDTTISLAVEQEKVTVSMKVNSKCKKVEAVTINFPTSVKTYTMEELMSQATQEEVTTEATEVTTVAVPETTPSK